MAEVRGYVCDGGCGATTTLEHPTDNVGNLGWFTTFTPHGFPTVYTCSIPCLIRCAERLAGPNLGREVTGG